MSLHLYAKELIIVEIGGKKLAVEIYVTHEVDKEK